VTPLRKPEIVLVMYIRYFLVGADVRGYCIHMVQVGENVTTSMVCTHADEHTRVCCYGSVRALLDSRDPALVKTTCVASSYVPWIPEPDSDLGTVGIVHSSICITAYLLYLWVN
jgi:hypothetical protein